MLPLASHLDVGRHPPADNAGADEGAERSVDRRVGRVSHKCSRFTRREHPARAINEVTRRKDHVAIAELAQSFRDGIGG